MTDTPDDSEKTEEPTPQRLQKARSQGQVANSREITTWLLLLGFTLFTAMIMPWYLEQVTITLSRFIARPDQFAFYAGDLKEALYETSLSVLLLTAIPVAITSVFAISSSLIQVGILFAPESITPKLSKLSPLQGLKRIFGAKGLLEVLKGLLKIFIVAALFVYLFYDNIGEFSSLSNYPIVYTLDKLWESVLLLLAYSLAALLLLAVADLVYTRYSHNKSLRMTQKEIKDERRRTEGSPEVKQRLNQLRVERARQRIASVIPEADVIITNPTHYAVALKYDIINPENRAPVLTAKGQDHLALHIRSLAEKHGVPIHEDPPLAREIYNNVAINEEIPVKLYEAVATIIKKIVALRQTARDRKQRAA